MTKNLRFGENRRAFRVGRSKSQPRAACEKVEAGFSQKRRLFQKRCLFQKRYLFNESRCCADSDESQKHLVRRIGKNKAAAKAVDEFVPAGALPAQALSLPR